MIIPEVFQVPPMRLSATRRRIRKGEEGKGKGGQRIGCHGKANPLHNFAKIIRCRNKAKGAAIRNFIIAFTYIKIKIILFLLKKKKMKTQFFRGIRVPGFLKFRSTLSECRLMKKPMKKMKIPRINLSLCVKNVQFRKKTLFSFFALCALCFASHLN